MGPSGSRFRTRHVGLPAVWRHGRALVGDRTGRGGAVGGRVGRRARSRSLQPVDVRQLREPAARLSEREPSIRPWRDPPFDRDVDAFFDMAAVRDPGFGRAVQSYPGLGGAVEIPLPRRVLLAVEYGYGFKAQNTDGSRGTHVVKITGFKIF